MTRLFLIVEGQTEKNFAITVLKPHLVAQGVFLVGARLTALCRKRGLVHRGGMKRYLPVKNDIERWLKEDRSPDAHFSTMLDLYGLPTDFPDYNEAAKKQDPYLRVAELEAAFQEDIGDQRFIPYIQLHEFEALLLTDPRAFAHEFAGRDREIEKLARLAEAYASPELIDDGQQTAPSKRIAKEIYQYPGVKPTAGPVIAEEIGLDRIRKACPHFNDWLTKLENLAAA
jgi:hypothetical protein